MTCVQNDFLRAIDEQRAVLLLMLDLSATFDTVDHGIFLQRLRDDFGTVGSALEWYSTYLENRSFRVYISGAYFWIMAFPSGVSWPSGLAYRTQVLVLATECGFESQP